MVVNYLIPDTPRPITTAEILEHLRCVCLRCGYEWIRRPQAEPRVCLQCKSTLWRVPKKVKTA